MSKGKFIVITGGEGSGKTTQVKLLAKRMARSGRITLITKEPGGDEGVLADIRKILLNQNYSVTVAPKAELFLFLADRAHHLKTVITPALQQGEDVICDRFSPDTFAYQVAARAVCSPSEFRRMNSFATDDLFPDLTIWIDLDPEIGLARNKNAQKRDRFESEDVLFHKKVRRGYQKYFSRLNPVLWRRIAGDGEIEEIHEKIWNETKPLLLK